jgi:zinc protease
MKKKLIVLLLIGIFLSSFSITLFAKSEEWDIGEFELDGLQVIYKKTGGETASIALFLKGGVRNLNESDQGIELFLFALSTRGSKKYPKDLLNSELARMGTSIGVKAERDYSVIFLRCLNRYFEESWDIFTDLILNPAFEEGEAELVREQLVAKAKQVKDNPDSWIGRLARELFFENHPYALAPEGTPDSLTNISLEELKAYHEQQLITSKLLLVVVGNLAPSKLKEMIEGSFGSLPKGEYHPMPLPKIENQVEIRVEKREIPTNYVVGLWVAPSLESEDYYPMLIATEILKYRFWRQIKGKEALAYEVYASLASESSNWGTLYVCTKKPNEAIKLMFGEIEKINQREVSSEELESIVYLFVTNYYLAQESTLEQTLRLGLLELNGKGWETEREAIEKMNQVTPQDIRRVSNQWIKNISFGFLGPSKVERKLFLQTCEELAYPQIY